MRFMVEDEGWADIVTRNIAGGEKANLELLYSRWLELDPSMNINPEFLATWALETYLPKPMRRLIQRRVLHCMRSRSSHSRARARAFHQCGGRTAKNADKL